MSSIVQPDYGMRAYGVPQRSCETKQVGMMGSSFLDLLAKAGDKANDVPDIKSTESAQQKTELSESEDMQLFKKAFYEDLSKITVSPTVSNAAVRISDAAFQAMKNDPEYRSRVLSLLRGIWVLLMRQEIVLFCLRLERILSNTGVMRGLLATILNFVCAQRTVFIKERKKAESVSKNFLRHCGNKDCWKKWLWIDAV